METSYYVGAEPKNAVQSEKFWRNRIDAEEGAAVRATAQSLLERSCPITGRRPISHRSERTPRSALVSRGKEIAGSEVGDLEKVAKLQQTATPRLQTASSRISVATSFSAISCRSTVLSLELEIERERRQAAEKELEELRKKLAESQRQSAASSQPSNSETSKPTKRSSKSWP